VYEPYLEAVVQWRRGMGFSVPPPASAEQVAALRQLARARLESAIPDAFGEFLSRVNGLDVAGLLVYPADAFVEKNLAWRRDDYYSNLLVFAESGRHLYVYDISQRRYQVLERATGGVERSFVAFQNLMRAALATHPVQDPAQ
jgi:hypothetical protein